MEEKEMARLYYIRARLPISPTNPRSSTQGNNKAFDLDVAIERYLIL